MTDRIALPSYAPLDATDDPVHRARAERRRAAGLLAGFTDAHVHLFPDGFYRALWRWFDAHAWAIRFRGTADEVLDELRRAGARRVVALVYAHRPGVARVLNAFLGELCRTNRDVIGVGTVLPGEPDAERIVREAVSVHGLRGIKLHCHVQKLAIDDARTMAVLAQCETMGIPAVVHSGREPATNAYGIEPRALCGVVRTRRVLRAMPRLRLVVPHVGADEFDAHVELLREHEHVHLDTSMACAEYFAERPSWQSIEQNAGRIMYGSDFPITPYGYEREVEILARRIENDAALAELMHGTATRLWG